MKTKLPKTKPFNKDEYAKALKLMEWDELAQDLMELEIEFESLKSHLLQEDFVLFQQLIEIYETEKAQRVSDSYDHSRRYYNETSIMTPETELMEEDLENM